MSENLNDFKSLFEGRWDAYGKVWGESVRTPLTMIHWEAHLEGDTDRDSLGIYPMIQSEELAEVWTARLGRPVPPHFVKWGCSDIDDGYEKSLPLARNMQKAAQLLGLDLWVEVTKSKGYHCWLFADEWVPAEVMRRALLALHQVAGVQPTEVNPKQVETARLKVGLGNYVNLPYAASAPEGRRVMISVERDDIEWGLGTFLEMVVPATFEALYETGALYKPPPRKAVVRIVEPSAEAEALAPKLTGLAYKIWKEGPLEGRDRSTTLARLAHLMAEGGTLTPGEGLVLLRDADGRWGKFFERADGDEQLAAMIEAASWST